MDADKNVKVINQVQIQSPNGWPLNMIVGKADVVVPNVATILQPGLLYVGVGGDVLCRPVGNKTLVLFKNIPNGSFLPVYVDVVSGAASTTATDMLICY